MNERNKNGFTLVELLAVIVILAIILVIAVPQIMNTINDTTKASFESSAKMVASQVENQYTIAQTLDKSEEEFNRTSGDCMQEWAGLNDADYASCRYKIASDGTAKVTLVGKGKFKGFSVCNGTRSEATATTNNCPLVPVSFASDDWTTIVAAVQSGNHPYQVGNTKTIEMDIDNNGKGEEYTIRVANTTKCSDIQPTLSSQTACGFVIEFVDIITEYSMNDTETNVGGWPVSGMRTYVNETIYNAIPEELRNGIIKTYIVSGYGSTSGEKNFTSEDYLYLLSPQELYGTTVADTSNGTSRQLDYYEDNEVSTNEETMVDYNTDLVIKKYQGTPIFWWLRSAYYEDNYTFFAVHSSGVWVYNSAKLGYGVSPAFRLSN